MAHHPLEQGITSLRYNVLIQYMLLLTALLLYEYPIPFAIHRPLPEPSLPMTLRQKNPIIRSFKFLGYLQKPVYGLP